MKLLAPLAACWFLFVGAGTLTGADVKGHASMYYIELNAADSLAAAEVDTFVMRLPDVQVFDNDDGPNLVFQSVGAESLQVRVDASTDGVSWHIHTSFAAFGGGEILPASTTVAPTEIAMGYAVMWYRVLVKNNLSGTAYARKALARVRMNVPKQ